MNALRTFLAVLFAAAALACGAGTPKIDNVVLISLDTTRADALGCYGNDAGTTPNLDALAAEGVLFETAISPVPITMPAHSTLFTGLTPPNHGVRGNLDHRLDPSNQTLAELLAGHVENSAGFISARVLDARFGIDQGFDLWDDELEASRHKAFGAERRGGETVDLATRWLEANAAEPFLLFVHLYDPHEVYEPPEPFATRFVDNLYLGEVAYTDAQIGRLLATLSRLEVEENTAVIVVGDHGELLGEHGEFTHTYYVYENAVRVPLIMRIPGVEGGRRISGTVGLVDVMPTLSGLLGILPPDSDGRDLSTLILNGGEGDLDRPIYCESLTPTRYGANSLRSVRSSLWSFIRTKRPELYDLEEDPGEAVNLVADRTEEVRRLEAILADMISTEKTDLDAAVEVDPETAAQLAALGYMSSAVDTDVDLDPERPDPKDLITYHVAHQRTFMAATAGRWDEAEAACLEVLDGLPDFWEANSNLAKIRIGQKRWAESLPLLERALELKPDQYEIVYDQGLALTELGDLEGAADAFRRAVPLDPEPPKAELNLSRALFNLGQTEAALEHAEVVAREGAQFAGMLRLLGDLLLDFDQIEAAVPVFEQLLTLRPNDTETRNSLGLMLAGAGRLEAARAQFEAIVRIEPASAGAHLNLGMIALQTGQGDAALESAAAHFSRAVSSDPSLATAHLNLALANLHLGRTAEAIAGLRRTLELEPDQPQVLDQLAWLLIDVPDPALRNPAEAVRRADRACALTGRQDPSLLSTLAAAHAATGDTALAAAVAGRALELARAQGRPDLVRQLQNDLARYR
jgi:tetratricopeptide (TPR) repeat protein